MNGFRRMVLEGEFEYGNAMLYSCGVARMIDHHGRDIHNLGLRYTPAGTYHRERHGKTKLLQPRETETAVIADCWPHDECEGSGISGCAHLREIDNFYRDFIELIRKDEGNGCGSVKFSLQTDIGIKYRQDKQIFEFEGRCGASCHEKDRYEKKRTVLRPEQTIYMAVYRNGDFDNPSSYFVGSVDMPGNKICVPNVNVFPLSAMKHRIEEEIGGSEGLGLILKPLYGAVVVTILGAVTDFFTADGEKNFDAWIMNELKKPAEQQNEVFIKMTECNGLANKKKRLMSGLDGLSTRLSSPSV